MQSFFLLCISTFFVFVISSSPEPTCPPGSVPHLTGSNKTTCFQFFDQLKPFWEAESMCKSLNGHLAVVNDAFTDYFLVDLVRQTAPQISVFWIGGRTRAYTSFNVWTWTNNDLLVDYTNWRDPLASGTTPVPGYCLSVGIQHDFWTADRCNSSQPFVCQLPAAVRYCDYEYTLFEETQMCYRLVSDRLNMKTFDGAEANCTAERGHLASIHSDFENAFVASLAPGRLLGDGSMHLWIGARSDANGVWGWTDGSPFNYSNWYRGTQLHKNTCTFFISDGAQKGELRLKWEGDYPFSKQIGRFICKKPPNQVFLR